MITTSIRATILDAFLREYPQADSSHVEIYQSPSSSNKYVDWERPNRSQTAPITYAVIEVRMGDRVSYAFEEC